LPSSSSYTIEGAYWHSQFRFFVQVKGFSLSLPTVPESGQAGSQSIGLGVGYGF
jgi:hypothetical protein